MVWTEGVELVGEGVDLPVNVFEIVVAPLCGIEPPGTVVAFDVSVECGGGGVEEVDAAFLAFALEVGLGAAPWMVGKGMSAWSLSRKRLALRAVALRQACAQVHLVTGSQAVNWGAS